MGNIIGINLMQNQIFIAAPGEEKTFCVGVQGGDEELFATAKRTSQQVYGQAAEEAVAVIPARLSITQRAALSKKASRRGIKVLRFLSLTNAALLGDYARNPAEYRKADALLVLTAVCRGNYLELALTDVGDGVAEVLAIVMANQVNADSVPKAFQKLLADAGKNPEEVQRLVFAEDAIQSELIYTTALDNALSCATVRNYTSEDLTRGAAVYAAKLNGTGDCPLLLDVLPRSVGFKLADGSFCPILARNETIPTAQSVQVYPSAETSDAMEITLYEGDSRNPEKNKKLGTFHAAISAGSKAPFEIHLDADLNGVCNLRVKDSEGNNQILSAGTEGTFPLPATAPAKPQPQSDAPESPAAPVSPDAAQTAMKFLPVYDDLLLALDHPTKDPAYEKGIRLALKKMEAVFRQQGVEFYAAAGEQFDPRIHEAVMHISSASHGTNVVAKVLKKGVKVNGKITRFAMVQVAN